MSTAHPWSLSFTLPIGQLEMEPDECYPPNTYQVFYHHPQEGRRLVSTVADLPGVLVRAGTTLEHFIGEDPRLVAHLICCMTGRDTHTIIRDNMWHDLESCFSLDRTNYEPVIRNHVFTFLTYTQYMPRLVIHQVILDLTTLSVTDIRIIDTPWPPQEESNPQ